MRLTDKRLPKGVATWTTTKFSNTKSGRQRADKFLGAKRDAMLDNLEANRPPKESDMLDGRATVVPTLKTDRSFRTIAVPADGRRAFAAQLDRTEIADGDTLVHLDAGDRLVAKVTPAAVAALGLRAGARVHVVVKAQAIRRVA